MIVCARINPVTFLVEEVANLRSANWANTNLDGYWVEGGDDDGEGPRQSAKVGRGYDSDTSERFADVYEEGRSYRVNEVVFFPFDEAIWRNIKDGNTLRPGLTNDWRTSSLDGHDSYMSEDQWPDGRICLHGGRRYQAIIDNPTSVPDAGTLTGDWLDLDQYELPGSVTEDDIVQEKDRVRARKIANAQPWERDVQYKDRTIVTRKGWYWLATRDHKSRPANRPGQGTDHWTRLRRVS